MQTTASRSLMLMAYLCGETSVDTNVEIWRNTIVLWILNGKSWLINLNGWCDESDLIHRLNSFWHCDQYEYGSIRCISIISLLFLCLFAHYSPFEWVNLHEPKKSDGFLITTTKYSYKTLRKTMCRILSISSFAAPHFEKCHHVLSVRGKLRCYF